MKKVILILIATCLVCACGQKGPLVPPETMVSDVAIPELIGIFSSHY